MVAITKNAQGYGYNYTDFATLRELTVPVLAAHGLTIIQMPVSAQEEGHVGVRTILAHSSGDVVMSECAIRVSDHKGMSFEQCAGTAITYLRRYAWLAVCGLASEDNDAATPSPKSNEASNKGKGGW